MLYCPVSRCPNIDLRSSGVLVIDLATEVSDHGVESVKVLRWMIAWFSEGDCSRHVSSWQTMNDAAVVHGS